MVYNLYPQLKILLFYTANVKMLHEEYHGTAHLNACGTAIYAGSNNHWTPRRLYATIAPPVLAGCGAAQGLIHSFIKGGRSSESQGFYAD
jgi:hypothetical protein